MKKIIGTFMLIVSTVLSIVVGIGMIIVSIHMLKMLWKGSINPTLCIQFIGFVGAFALLFTLSTIFGRWCDVDVQITDTSTVHPSTEEDEDYEYYRPNIPTMTEIDRKDKTVSSLPSEYIVNGKKCSELLKGAVDYDGSSLYPSSKMGVSLDHMTYQCINNKSKHERMKDDE